MINNLLFSLNELKQQNLERFQSLHTLLHQQEKNLITLTHDGQQKNLTRINETIQSQMADIREQLNHSFKYHADSLNTHIAKLNEEVKENLRNI